MVPRPTWIARGLAVLVAVACVPLAPAGADAPPEYVPGIVRPDTMPVQEPDPRAVVPTDTVVEPPLPGVQLDPWLNGNFYYGWVVPGPNIAWGLIAWDSTSAGPAVGARVTMTHRVDGWRYSTTTDRFGRWRMSVPDGPYVAEIVPRPQDVPYGLRAGGTAGGSYWGQGLGAGQMWSLQARPRHSCTTHGTLIDGAEGWAPGVAAGGATCPYADDPTFETLAQFVRFGSLDTIEWALSGRDKDPVRATPTPTPHGTSTARPASTPIVLPVLAGAARVARGGTVRIRVRCAAGVRCGGGLALTAPAARVRAARSAPAVLARGTLGRGTAARLRVTTAGRRATRRRTVRAQAVWTPVGGAPMVIGFVRLHPAAR